MVRAFFEDTTEIDINRYPDVINPYIIGLFSWQETDEEGVLSFVYNTGAYYKITFFKFTTQEAIEERLDDLYREDITSLITVIATVNGKEITLSEIQGRINIMKRCFRMRRVYRGTKNCRLQL
jgi:hypothetical protein